MNNAARQIMLCACAGLLLLGMARAEAVRTFIAMDTVMTLRAEEADEDLLEACEEDIHALEALLSVTDEDSEIHALNVTGRANLSEETAYVLREALTISAETGGALDVTLYPIVRAWGFTTGEYRVPEKNELDALLRYVDYRRVDLSEDNGAVIPEGTMIDLGAVAKGYAADRLAARLRSSGVKSALIDLGGNIGCLGTKPGGKPWRIGLRDPKGEAYFGVVSVQDAFVVTSGQYERYFTGEDGAVYDHIFDPQTGAPADGGLLSVSVIGSEGLTCDALSTALFVMGREKAAAWLQVHPDIQAVLLDDEGAIWITPGLRRFFTPYGQYASAVVHTLE